MADSHSSSSTPIRPAEILDPYPERVTSLVGARQTTHLTAVPDLDKSPVPATGAHTSFAASLAPRPSVVTVRRRFRAPIASTTITVFGQASLGALMATKTVDPVLGLMIFVGWLTCGIGLICAQCVQLARDETA